MSKKVKPLGENILVKRIEAEDKTKGGILLPDSAKEKPREGLVIATGDGRMADDGKRIGFQVKVDDRIIFTSYAGNEVKIDGQEYLLMHEDDILCVME